MASSPFPGVRRVVTGHSANGQATVLRDDLIKSPNNVHGVFRAEEFPIRNDAELKGEWVDTVVQPGKQSLIADGGAVSRVYDMAPGAFAVRRFGFLSYINY